MPFDSVFHPWGAAKFANDRPLIPTDRIIKALDKIETAGTRVTASTQALTDRLLKQASGKPIGEIDKLKFPIGPIIQEQMVGVWRSAWALGAAHAREEITIGIPKAIRQQAAGATFELDNQTLSLIAAFLTGEAGLVIPIGVEQAILARVLTIAGNYSKAVLDRLKGNLIAAMVPGADGRVISRKQLEQQIQATLGVARARAETIARNETTTAYNNARVRVMRESSIVTHVRFIGIDDARQTQICKSRQGMIIAIGDAGAIAANSPALHHRCRSYWSPVMGTINPSHADWVSDPDRAWDNRELAPLPEGWRIGDTAATFAARGSKGRRKGRGRKNCNKGSNCGGTCISAKKKCKKDNPSPTVKAKAKRGSKSGGGGGGAQTDNANLHELAKSGSAIVPEDLKKLDAEFTRIEKLEKAFNDAFDRDPGKAYDSPEWKALNKAEDGAEAIMAGIKAKLYQISPEDAGKLASQAKIAKSIGKVTDETELKSSLTEFYQLSGGRGSTSLKTLKFDDDRAYANENGVINVGRHGSKAEAKAVLFHELGHHVEFASPKTRDKLNDWIDSRSGGAKVAPLNSLQKNASYDKDEIARPDKFVDPYVGKVYEDKATEALSMGVERFSSPKSMLDFYKADREHFLITIGALND